MINVQNLLSLLNAALMRRMGDEKCRLYRKEKVLSERMRMKLGFFLGEKGCYRARQGFYLFLCAAADTIGGNREGYDLGRKSVRATLDSFFVSPFFFSTFLPSISV